MQPLLGDTVLADPVRCAAESQVAHQEFVPLWIGFVQIQVNFDVFWRLLDAEHPRRDAPPFDAPFPGVARVGVDPWAEV